jgi:hypothetical protein
MLHFGIHLLPPFVIAALGDADAYSDPNTTKKISAEHQEAQGIDQ